MRIKSKFRSYSVEAQQIAMEAHPGAAEAHNGDVEAHNEVMDKDCIRLFILTQIRIRLPK
jgi:hypothetical protein